MKPSVYTLRSIRFCYPGTNPEIPAIFIDQLRFSAGTVTAFLGENGSGKSTLLNLLAFVGTPAQTGKINFFGEPVRNCAITPSQRQKIAYLQQAPYLFRGSAAHNIALALRLAGFNRNDAEKRTSAILASFDLVTLTNQETVTLSAGQRQKVAVLRALAVDAEVLLLDEPFNHLDAEFSEQLFNELRRLREERTKTIIFSSHNHVIAHRLSDNLYRMETGQPHPCTDANLFHGAFDRARCQFQSGSLSIYMECDAAMVNWISVPKNQLILSRKRLDSSMQNMFLGKVAQLKPNKQGCMVTVTVGEHTIVAQITQHALERLSIKPPEKIWVGFKSSAVEIVQ